MGIIVSGFIVTACRQLLGKIHKNVRGNAAMLLALALVPIFSVAGFAIDHNRHVSAQNKIQASLDAAALATALRLNQEKLEESDLDPIAQAYFDTQLELNSAMALVPLNAKIVGDEVVLSVTGTLETSLMAIIGQRTMPLAAETAVVYNIQQPVEIALVVDTSGSMSGSKLTALKNAAYSLVDILLPEEDDASKNDAAKVSVIPFNDYVKIDTKYKNAS
jgi:Flp pilus assembly protein TadG